MLSPDVKTIIHAINLISSTLLVTNGLLLDNKMATFLAGEEKTIITISMDSPFKNDYESIRGPFYDKLLSNIDVLKKMVETGRMANRIILQMTVSKENFKHILPMLEFCADHRIKEINIIAIQENKKQRFYYKLPGYHASVGEIKRVALHKGIEARFINFSPVTKSELCRRPWTRPFIDVEGNLYPCCIHFVKDKKRVIIGNVFKETFVNLWNSKMFLDFRRNMLEGKYSDMCKKCPFLFG